ncbi:MAG: phosphoenolpyruvate carboxykinase (ATP), partial [bacterium]
FSVMNFLLPPRDVLPMHCSGNIGPDGKSAVFFGLSGTGKTTLSADSARTLIGDDEHGWGPDGVFNFEGGCYAKTINLTREAEPEIFETTGRFGSIIENVVMDPDTRELDFFDTALTENGRVSYSIEQIPNASKTGSGRHPANIMMLTCDAFGVLPTGYGVRDSDVERIQDWLFELNQALGPDSLILSELDGLRLRCLILLGRHDEATSLSDELLGANPSPQHRALAGVAYFHKAGESPEGVAADTAETYLADALMHSGLEVEFPDALYFYGARLYRSHQNEAYAEQFRRYLELVGEDEIDQPAYRAPLVRMAKTLLDR